jgi:hypothetical protein
MKNRQLVAVAGTDRSTVTVGLASSSAGSDTSGTSKVVPGVDDSAEPHWTILKDNP